MAGDAANAVLSVIAEKVITPIFDAIGRQCGYLFFYSRNIKNLKERAVHLEYSVKDTNLFFESQSWNNEERANSSAGWLKNAEEVIKAADEVVKDKDKLKGWCVNIKDRYILSRKSAKIATMILELGNQAPTLGATNPTLPPAKLPGSLSNYASKDFKTRMNVMYKAMEALKDDKINIIGICGLGGIGKTTILHELRERARTQNIFDEVAMTTVSQYQNVFNIQSDLASMLGFTSIKDEGNIIARADLLHKRLTNGSKILVVLDDVWSAIKLKEVGIPVRNDHAKCKVVLASRYKSVCTSMETQETISIEELSKEEAWHLFKKTAGDCVDKNKFEKIAKEVADECGGLPIALVTLARALSNKNKGVWEHALTQLRQSSVTRIPSMNKEVYPSIKLSYDFLASELLEAQPFLLICCQHAEDAEIKVEKLARYCLALELFKNVEKFVDVRNNTYAMIDYLSSCFLLQVVDVDEEGKYETVKIHDVVRDVCLSILSEMKEERDRVYMHIMAADMGGGYGLDNSKVDYSELKILMNAPLDGSLLDISFLQHMKELRVFENGPADMDHQPPTLHVLENLRMLSLECKSLSEEIMSSVGSLSKLEVLSFWLSKISSVPHHIGQLSNLKLLDLRCEEGEGLIPSGILLGLKKLEVLCMGNFLLLGADKNKDIQIGKSHGRITELDSLSNLITLQTNLVDPQDLLDLQHFRFEKLENFFLGSFRKFRYMRRSRLYAFVPNTIWLEDLVGVKWVLEAKIQGIVITTVNLQLRNIKDWTDPSLLEKFVSVRELVLYKCRQLEYVLPGRSLGELRRLELDDMPMLRHLWVVPTELMCLGNLREVEIYNCPAIESVFPDSAAKCLVQLESLRIGNCQKMEGIVSKGEGGITTTNRGAEIKGIGIVSILLFPKLRKLFLEKMPELGGFYNLKLEDDTEQPLLNPLVMLPSLENLRCCYVHQLKHILGGGMLELSKHAACEWLQNLREIYVFKCDSLETVFDFDGLHFMGENGHVLAFSALIILSLERLPNLEHLCRQIPDGIHAFLNLEELCVDDCNNLGYLISSPMAHMLVNLKRLSIEKCDSMKDVIKMNEDCGVKKIVFRSLRRVVLGNLKKLSSFCSHDQQSIEFPSLEEVFIYNCSEMKTFCCGHLTVEKLQGVNPSHPYDSGDTLIWKGDLNETIRHLSARVSKMSSDLEGDDPEEGIAVECTNEGLPMKASKPLSVLLSSPPVSDYNKELANSSNPDLRKVALPPLVEFVPSTSMEQPVHSSDSPVHPKADHKDLSDMSLSSPDDDWKRKRTLIQGVYVKAKLKTTFEEILTAKPNFLSGLCLKMARLKTDVIESAIRSLQILRQRTAVTISSKELAYIKDSLDDLDSIGLDIAWLERGYQRAILVLKEQKVILAAEELANLEREKIEDEAAFQMAREKLEMARAKMEGSAARRDDFKEVYGNLMQELEAGKELFGGVFDLETSLGDGLLD